MSAEEKLVRAEAGTWKFESFMVDHGFNKTQADHCVFVKKYDGGDFLILLLYVDDMLIVRQDLKKIASLKKALSKFFPMKDMGPAKQILGMHIFTGQKGFCGCRSKDSRVLQRFNMRNAKPVYSTLLTNSKLSGNQCSETKEEKAEINKIPYDWQ